VALGRRERAQQLTGDDRVGVREAGGEPALPGPVDHRGRPRGLDMGGALVPRLRHADRRPRAEHRHRIDGLRVGERQLQGDRTAHGITRHGERGRLRQ
jgi:hypothetical protein